MLQAGLRDLINAEATMQIGAGPHERTPERTTRRNGARPKMRATPAGEVNLAIPKLREGSFFPSLLSLRWRVDRALYAVICQAWLDGVSTRKVDQLVRALGDDTGISRSTVSRICSEIDEDVQEFLHHRIDHTWFPYLFLDATYLDVPVRSRLISQAFVVATGFSGEGRRDVLGMALGDAETTEFLRSLRDRGLKVATDPDPLGVRTGHERRARRHQGRGEGDPARIRVAALPGALRPQHHTEARVSAFQASQRANLHDLRADRP